MRYLEITGGFRMPYSLVEKEILDLCENGPLRPASLDERQKELCFKMVSRGLLNVIEDDDGEAYVPNSTRDLWRI